jgi:hypothetical protein
MQSHIQLPAARPSGLYANPMDVTTWRADAWGLTPLQKQEMQRQAMEQMLKNKTSSAQQQQQQQIQIPQFQQQRQMVQQAQMQPVQQMQQSVSPASQFTATLSSMGSNASAQGPAAYYGKAPISQQQVSEIF